MSAATLKRGTTRRPSAKGKPRVKAKARKQPNWIAPTLAKLWSYVPVKPETVERIVAGLTIILIGGALVAVAMAAGLPQFAGRQAAYALGGAGFQVKRVEVKGLSRMESLTVYAIALDQHSMAMPLVDLEKVRNELMQYGWIADARVQRRWPDTLVVDVVERKPAAIWQNRQKLSLIDDSGVVLERVDPNAMPDLPLVVGQNANRQVADLNELLDSAPALKPVLSGATWVGNRRWDLRFESGETLALPEGNDIAAKALKRFAHIDGVERLLGRGFVRFDMRDPSKMFVRVPRQGAGSVEAKSTSKGEG